MRLVLATHNPKKAREMAALLAELRPELEMLSLADFPGASEPEETGATFRENAEIKARCAAKETGLWALADDSGLMIDALEGAPGVYSKRFAGEHTGFEEKMVRILEQMRDLPETKRTARFRCCVAVCSPDGQVRFWEDVCEGFIGWAPRGSGGLGYDPIFVLPELGLTMAELSMDEKNRVSHRGKVLRAFASDWRP